eukprot:3313725-Alexandrium_andersonii.AAC.1
MLSVQGGHEEKDDELHEYVGRAQHLQRPQGLEAHRWEQGHGNGGFPIGGARALHPWMAVH